MYMPEGNLYYTDENKRFISSIDGLTEAMEKKIILEARVKLCTVSHDLIVDLPCCEGIVPREECALGINDGTTRDIAILSRVSKIICFRVIRLSIDQCGRTVAYLSRSVVQQECMERYVSTLTSGDIIDATVTHLEQFGSFVDIGCGIPSLIPIDSISVSRISHPSDRFTCGQRIKAIVKGKEGDRVFLTHKELLGTWEENMSFFHTGETVPAIIRSIEEYGIFVELAPNLAGLAEFKTGMSPGQHVSVYIKSVIPDKMKVKLVIVDVCGTDSEDVPIRYFVDGQHIDSWIYSPEECNKTIATFF